MLDIDDRLIDAYGTIEPSFDLGDVEADGRIMRRTRRRTVAVAASAACAAFLLLVVSVGPRLAPDQTTSIATQPAESAPRFVKPGPLSDALLHLPTIFDTDPLQRDEWPAGVPSRRGETAQLWRVTSESAARQVFVSFDAVAGRICLVVTAPAGSNSACSAMALAFGAPFTFGAGAMTGEPVSSGLDIALVPFEREGPELVAAAREHGATVTGGVVIAPAGAMPDVFSGGAERQLARLPAGVSDPAVSVRVDGQQQPFLQPTMAACVRSDHGIWARLADDLGESTISAPTAAVDALGSIDMNFSSRVRRAGYSIGEVAGPIVFMAPNASVDELALVAAQLRQNPATAEYEFFDQAAAWVEFNELFADAEVLAGTVTAADLPSSFRLGSEAFADLGFLEAIQERPGVFDVVSPHSFHAIVRPATSDEQMAPPITDQLVVDAIDAGGPIVYANFSYGASTIELIVNCGVDHLDARTTAYARSESATSQIARLAVGDVVGALHIPSIGAQVEVQRGVGTNTLQPGAGSYRSTPPPGLAGNSVIAAHRTTFGAPFAELDRLKAGDVIVATTADGNAIYLVTTTKVVAPTATEVLDDFGDNRLTLITEHPPYASTQRLVVTSMLVGAPRVSDVDWSLEEPPASLN